MLRGDAIDRKRGHVLIKVPSTGIPGVAPDSVIELLMPVHGLVGALKNLEQGTDEHVSRTGV